MTGGLENLSSTTLEPWANHLTYLGFCFSSCKTQVLDRMIFQVYSNCTMVMMKSVYRSNNTNTSHFYNVLVYKAFLCTAHLIPTVSL